MVQIGRSLTGPMCNTSNLKRKSLVVTCFFFLLVFYFSNLVGEEEATKHAAPGGGSGSSPQQNEEDGGIAMPLVNHDHDHDHDHGEKKHGEETSAEEESHEDASSKNSHEDAADTDDGQGADSKEADTPAEDTNQNSSKTDGDGGDAKADDSDPGAGTEAEADEDEDADAPDESHESQSTTKSSDSEPKGEGETEQSKDTAKLVSKHQLLNCKQDDPSRWSNKPHKPSTIQSLFNCDLPDAKCKYFYPANFFDAECGLGKQFAYHIDDAKAKMANNTLWNSMPSVGFPTLTMKNMCIVAETGVRVRYDASEQIESEIELTDIGEHNEDGNHCMTERLSFLHVHKAGGSSLHSAFNYIAANAHADLVRHKFFTPRNRPGGTYEMTPRQEEMRTFTLDSLAEATRYPDEKFTIHQHTIFAAVRDPTERFISSIGQALGASGSGGNKIGGVLLKECVKTTSHAALSCLAKYVRDHGFWIELHFTPQVVDIAFTTMYQDVPVAIFPMKPHLTTVLTYFGRGDVKARDGSQKNYRSDPILTNMTVADYDDETLEIVCHLYEIDVRMQRSLGMEVPRCDPFIPHEYDFQF